VAGHSLLAPESELGGSGRIHGRTYDCLGLFATLATAPASETDSASPNQSVSSERMPHAIAGEAEHTEPAHSTSREGCSRDASPPLCIRERRLELERGSEELV
jgi:hypothetical protein